QSEIGSYTKRITPLSPISQILPMSSSSPSWSCITPEKWQPTISWKPCRGSYGVSGAVDTILVMANKPNGDVLDIRCRDVESAELAIEFDKQTCRWRLLGDAAEVHVSSQRAKIIAALNEAGLAMRIPALMETTGMKRNPLEVLLGRMAREGEIQRIGKGLYAHIDYVTPYDDP